MLIQHIEREDDCLERVAAPVGLRILFGMRVLERDAIREREVVRRTLRCAERGVGQRRGHQELAERRRSAQAAGGTRRAPFLRGRRAAVLPGEGGRGHAGQREHQYQGRGRGDAGRQGAGQHGPRDGGQVEHGGVERERGPRQRGARVLGPQAAHAGTQWRVDQARSGRGANAQAPRCHDPPGRQRRRAERAEDHAHHDPHRSASCADHDPSDEYGHRAGAHEDDGHRDLTARPPSSFRAGTSPSPRSRRRTR